MIEIKENYKRMRCSQYMKVDSNINTTDLNHINPSEREVLTTQSTPRKCITRFKDIK